MNYYFVFKNQEIYFFLTEDCITKEKYNSMIEYCKKYLKCKKFSVNFDASRLLFVNIIDKDLTRKELVNLMFDFPYTKCL
jgi:hypothetical protein